MTVYDMDEPEAMGQLADIQEPSDAGSIDGYGECEVCGEWDCKCAFLASKYAKYEVY